MPVPDFSPGEVLTAAAMDSIGMWLVKTVTIGPTVTSVPVTDVFSSDFDRYRIIVRVDSATTSSALSVRYGTSSPVASNYKSFLWTPLNAWTSGVTTSVTSVTGSIISYCHPTNISGSMDVINPYLATNTNAYGNYATDSNGGITASNQTDNTQFTRFYLEPESGTITGGTIKVYGYRN
jgi:predicted small secreted protein